MPKERHAVKVTIWPNKYDYAPSEKVIDDLRKRAKRSGFFYDWDLVTVLESGDLCLTWFDENKAAAHSMIASKRPVKWKFFTDSYLELGERSATTK